MENSKQVNRNTALRLVQEFENTVTARAKATAESHGEAWVNTLYTQRTIALANLLTFIDELIGASGYSPGVSEMIRKNNEELYGGSK